MGGVISIPENIGHSVIEASLNPPEYSTFYLDKNMFPKFIGVDKCPKTIVCRIHGSTLLGADYKPLEYPLEKVLNEKEDIQLVVLKPSIDSCSGHGVMAFKRESDKYFYNGQELTERFLLDYGQDFTLQEGIIQSEYMRQFNTSSVNTIRLYVYKSVKDNQCHVVGGALRIGKNGSFLDNAHAGGRFVGINMENGELGKTTYDTEGFASPEHNGVDFSKGCFHIPNWNAVKEFAANVVTAIPHMRYVGLDIALDKRDNPTLIEYNCGNGSMITGAGFWLLLYTQQHPFGEFTDEIVEYCLSKQINKNE